MGGVMRAVSCGLVLAAALLTYRTMPAEDGFYANADEGRYLYYAKEVSTQGVNRIPVLVREYMTTPGAHPYPHPGRVGHTLITAAWLKLFPPTFRSLAHLSFLAFLVCLGVSFHFARKYLGTDTALLYVLLLASSPLTMAAARRVLQDSVLNCAWVGAFWLFFDYLMTPSRLRLALFTAVFALAITIKEASVPLIGFFALGWVIFKDRYGKPLPWLEGVVLLGAPLTLAAAIDIFFLGGLTNFLSVVRFAASVHLSAVESPTEYAAFATGPWYKFVIDFLLLSPLTTLLAIGYFFHLLATKAFDPLRTYCVLFCVFMLATFGNLSHTKIVRFVMTLDTTLMLFTLWMLDAVFEGAERQVRSTAVILSVCVICGLNLLNYQHLYGELQIYDPISVWLLVGQKVLPYFNFLPGDVP